MIFSVILPAYNEAENLKILIPSIHDVMKDFDYEIIVVDDNSPDHTQGVVQELFKKNIPVQIIVRKKDKGFANSIRTGIEASNSEYIIIMDSDGNHNPSYLPFMCKNTEFYDCIVASRFQYGGGMQDKSRQTLSWIFNLFVRFISGNYITDSLFGYLVVKRSLLQQLDFDQIFWGYGDYCIRLLFYLQKLKTPILQFPAKHGERVHGQGNSKLIQVFFQYLSESLKLVFKERFLNGK